MCRQPRTASSQGIDAVMGGRAHADLSKTASTGNQWPLRERECHRFMHKSQRQVAPTGTSSAFGPLTMGASKYMLDSTEIPRKSRALWSND